MPLIEHAKKVIAKHAEIEPAVQALMKIVLKDKELQEECIRPAVQRAIYEARGMSTRYTKCHNPSVINARSIALNAATVSEAFLDTWMVGGKVLGDLNRADLLVEAEQEHAQAAARRKCAVFYETLAARVPDGKVVRDVFKHDEARKLYETAHRPKRRGDGDDDRPFASV